MHEKIPTEIPASGMPRRGVILAACGLAALPLVVLLYKLPQYGLGFPYWDDLLLAPFLERAYAGQLSFSELWTQHNEHRPFFPRLIMIGLALITRWDVRWVLGVNLVLGAGIFALLAKLALRIPGRPWALLPWLSFFVFSWAQMENWVWGLEVTVFLCNFAVVLGIVLLGLSSSWAAFIAALACGVVATYSFANGMIYWVAALPALFLAIPATGPRPQVMARAAAWAACGALSIGCYFIHYTKPGVSPSLLSILKAPHEYLGYVLLYLGSPVVAIFSTPPWHGGPPHPIGALHFVPGGVAAALALYLAWRIARLPVIPWPALGPWLSLAAFAVCSALATGLGRVGFGIAQGLNSRYMTTGMLFWCALGGVYFLLRANAPDRKPLLSAAPAWTAGAAVLLGALFMTLQSNAPWEENARWKQLGWRALRAGFEPELYLRDLCWDPRALKEEYLPFLRANELAGFTKQPPAPDPKEAGGYLTQGELLLSRGLLRPALTYADAALFFDPLHAEAKTLREKVLAEAQRRNNTPQ